MRFLTGIWIRAALPAVLAFAAFAFAASAAADIYSWTDKNGVKHFSSDPPPKGEPVTELRVMKTTYEPDEPEAADPGKAAKDTTSLEALKNQPKVDIYVNGQSDICRTALAFFDSNKIVYTRHDMDADPGARQRYNSLEGQGLPLVFIGDYRMDGWDENAVRTRLGIK